MNLFQRILVPLDGSLRAERALPLAVRIARASRGSLILLRVIEAMPEQNTALTSTSVLEKGRVHAQMDEAQQYLTALAHANEIADLSPTLVVQAGPVIPTIMTIAQPAQANLLVLCGPQGSREPVSCLDSMVEQCLEQTSIPLLLVPVQGEVLRRQNHPCTLLLAFDQAQLERSLLEPAITLLMALAVREQEQLHGIGACTLRAFPPSFNALNPSGRQKNSNMDQCDYRKGQFTLAPGKQREDNLEARESRDEGDMLVLGMPPQPERARWIHHHRKERAFSAWSLPVLFVPFFEKSPVGAPR